MTDRISAKVLSPAELLVGAAWGDPAPRYITGIAAAASNTASVGRGLSRDIPRV
jgi:hypothetical protein